MYSIQESFQNSRKRKVQYDDHYEQYNKYHRSFDRLNQSYVNDAGPSSRRPFMPSRGREESIPPLTGDPTFDILDWHPAYQSCQRFFLDHAQHEPATQALCALVNIRLPFQYLTNPIESSTPANASQPPPVSFSYPRSGSSPSSRNQSSPSRGAPTFVSLIPYIKRLVVTGFDKPAILHGLFGDDHKRGITPHLDCERRNYLFAAKNGGWACKKQYDHGSGMGGDESVPFMKPLEEANMTELNAAEKAWSGWLAMEDWMVGPLAPKDAPEVSRLETRRDLVNGDAHVNGTERLPDGVPEAFERQGAVQMNGGSRETPSEER